MSDAEQKVPPPLSDEERKLGRWIALGLAAALVGSIGGVLVELLFS